MSDDKKFGNFWQLGFFRSKGRQERNTLHFYIYFH